SPWLGRSNGVGLLIHGSQRYASRIPLVRVKSQVEPDVVLRGVARYCIRTTVVAPGSRMPPSGKWIVWSVTVGWTATPSTVAPLIVLPPRRAPDGLLLAQSIRVRHRHAP